jgi:hypothetical protein
MTTEHIMPEHFSRFECRPEPAGTWMVWDMVKNAPANLGGCILRGREQHRAEAARAILTKIYNCRLDARSVRRDIRR